MRVQILYGYRSALTNGHYLPPGEHDLDPSLVSYLVENGHAMALEEMPVSKKPRRKIVGDIETVDGMDDDGS